MTQPDPELSGFLMRALDPDIPPCTYTAKDGVQYGVEVDPGPGMRRRVRPIDAHATGGVEFILWARSEMRPARYPPETPFVPGVELRTLRPGSPAQPCVTSFVATGTTSEPVRRILDEGRALGWTDAPAANR